LIIILSLVPFCDSIAVENEYFRKAMDLYARREYALAADTFEEARNIEPRNADIYFYLGNAYYAQDALDEAIMNYTAGLNFTDQKGKFFYNLGNCYYRKGNYGFSADMYAQALENDPGIHDAHLNAGNAYYHLGLYENTIRQWETYLVKHPETDQYADIRKAIAYLKNRPAAPAAETEDADDLLDDVLGELDRLVEETENIMEVSEDPVDDLTIEGIEP
jgi:tetratricopeptide (TPR) repeat protein